MAIMLHPGPFPMPRRYFLTECVPKPGPTLREKNDQDQSDTFHGFVFLAITEVPTMLKNKACSCAPGDGSTVHLPTLPSPGP